MESVKQKYTYMSLTTEQPILVERAAACLSKTFVGIQVGEDFIQEPMIGHLHLPYDAFYEFTKEYLEATVDLGFCVVAKDENDEIVGVLAGDTLPIEPFGNEPFTGKLEDMNEIISVLEDVEHRFLEDYTKRFGPLNEGDLLHLFLLGVIAEKGRQEIVKNLGDLLFQKAKESNVKIILGEATTPKSMRLLEKFHGFGKYIDIDGNPIVHYYRDNKKFAKLSHTISEGTYIITKVLEDRKEEF